MRIKNQKGFTLVELIIAISIMSIVIGLGYNVVNKITIASKSQSKVTDNQLNANLINKYVTKDLEVCKTFKGPAESSVGTEYEFIINEGSNEIKYKVSTELKGSKEVYNLTRYNNGTEIDLITSQPKISEKPFYISESEENQNLYLVQLDNIKESSGKYEFEVSSRVMVSSSESIEIPTDPAPGTTDPDEEGTLPEPEPIKPEVKPEEIFTEQYKASFWVNDSSSNKVDIGISNTGAKKGNGTTLYKQEVNVKKNDTNSNNRYSISMKSNVYNSSKHECMSIIYGQGSVGGEDLFSTQNLNGKVIDQLVIEVSEGNEFELELLKVDSKSQIKEKVHIGSGKYKYTLVSGNLIEVKGTIIKNNSKAQVDIYYGKSK